VLNRCRRGAGRPTVAGHIIAAVRLAPRQLQLAVGAVVAMSKAPPKRRMITQAPPPSEPLPRGSYVAPTNAKADRPSTETLQKVELFQEAVRHCYDAIIKVRSVNSVDEKLSAYVAKRWSEVLRPELARAIARCRDAGIPADKLAEFGARAEKLDCEWRLVCQYRDGISPKHLPSVTASESRAINTAHEKPTAPGAKTRGILEAINQLWPGGIPNGLSAKDRNKEIITQLAKNKSSVPQNIARAVQRALKALRSK
jgi:hypothetical protein